MTDHLTCAELVEQLTDLLDGALNDAARGRLLEHLADCDGCDEYLRQFRLTIGVLGTMPAELEESRDSAAHGKLLAAYRARR